MGLLVLENVLYIRDYNEVVILSNYVRYEVMYNGFIGVIENNYEIHVYDDKFTIIYHRNGLIKNSFYKTIYYDGIIY